MSTTVVKKSKIQIKAITAVLAIISSVALPHVFHAMGAISGTGAMLGSTFLPMHLPVLLAGLLSGPVIGLAAGLLSPIISFAVSGMPVVTALPFMVLELAAYGVAGGFLRKVNMPVIAKLLIVQITGRAVRAAAILVAVYGFNSHAVGLQSIWTNITAALPGIILQWALIPLLLYRMTGLQKYYG